MLYSLAVVLIVLWLLGVVGLFGPIESIRIGR